MARAGVGRGRWVIVLAGLGAVGVLAAVVASVVADRDDPTNRIASARRTCGPAGNLIATIGDPKGYQGSAAVEIGSAGRGHAPITGSWEAIAPAFGPDGGRIVVSRAVDGSNWDEVEPGRIELWTLDLDGRNPKRITQGGVDTWPAWSPDGKRIVFSHRPPKSYPAQLVTVSADGQDPVVVRRPRARHDLIAADWSPDGRRLAFLDVDYDDDERSVEIWTMSSDGGRARRLVRMRGVEAVDWYRSGDALLVSRSGVRTDTSFTEPRVLKVDLADGSVHLLAMNAGLARWAPDGRTVYFHKYVSATGGARTVRGHIEDGALVADAVVFAEVVGVDAYDGFAVGPCAARPGVVFAVMSPDDTSMQPEEIRVSSSEQSTGRLSTNHGYNVALGGPIGSGVLARRQSTCAWGHAGAPSERSVPTHTGTGILLHGQDGHPGVRYRLAVPGQRRARPLCEASRHANRVVNGHDLRMVNARASPYSRRW